MGVKTPWCSGTGRLCDCLFEKNLKKDCERLLFVVHMVCVKHRQFLKQICAAEFRCYLRKIFRGQKVETRVGVGDWAKGRGLHYWVCGLWLHSRTTGLVGISRLCKVSIFAHSFNPLCNSLEITVHRHCENTFLFP